MDASSERLGGRAHLMPVARDVFVLLTPFSLLVADATLDEARRIAWMARFSGVIGGQASHVLGSHEYAVAIFDKLKTLSIEDADLVIADARVALWMQHFAAQEGSAFARSLAGTVEHAEAVQRGGKPH